jgi:hypothetical protein
MPRFIDLITECLKDTEREVLQKRRVVNVVVHGGGWKRNEKKKKRAKIHALPLFLQI